MLAGGASTRFGAPKGLATVRGVRIVDRVAAALRDATPHLRLAANAPEAAEWLPGVPVIRDAMPGGGGLRGVHAALARERRPVLVVAWDMPFVSGALLRDLVARLARTNALAAVPVSASPVGLEPFCACYAPACLAPLEAALAGGHAGAARFVRSLPAVAWMTESDVAAFGDPARLFFSVNTPADLARAEAMAAPLV